ncbi:alpha/beta fold hydrolase [Curtobacterium sp. 'Ferrero']|uniref:alpha/beta fold hydrolase n=1 Tax=Curtobacterium sp. 'Ferrero' TaxID=2033654 RepID=UPI0015965735|nr:alpha/beta fold hydrolase [Curtobacterium sp. 'Ferrero']
MHATATTGDAPWHHVPAVGDAADHSILDRWDRVVADHGDEPALIEAGGDRSFADVDRAARGLAAELLDALLADDHGGSGVGPVRGGAPRPVGVMAGQTPDTIVTLLALVRARRTVVVLDDHLPPARLAHVVRLADVQEIVAAPDHREQAGAALAAARQDERTSAHQDERTIAHQDEHATAHTDGHPGRVHDLAVLRARAVDRPAPSDAAPAGSDPRPGGFDPLVIVFTSGSTGLPKGVVVTHRQQVRDAEAHAEALGFAAGDRLAIAAPLSFTAGIMYALAGLMDGVAVVALEPRDRGVEGIVQDLATHRATVVLGTPHLLRSITGAAAASGSGPRPGLTGLRLVVTVGEPITGTDVAAARPHLGPHTVLVNGFGASELASVAFCPVRPEDPVPEGVVPAGGPIASKTVRIVRPDGSEAEPGETGELVVVSDGVTTGYWGDPEQTAAHRSSTPDGTPTWRHGDLAKLDDAGRLVLVGRSDDAVKVRGYLVEPTEVEAALRAVPEVGDVVVTALVAPPAVTRLVAYVVPRPGHRTPAPAALRRTLRDRLPEYMVPASIVPMTALPRNERGKVDRSALPGAPVVETVMTESTHDQWELVVGQVWAAVLGLSGVPLDEDFAALGGDSLSAEEMLAVVHERLGVDLRASELLEHPTLRQFAARVRAGTTALPSHPDVVKVSTAREAGHPPVFCLAGGGALALTFLPLSRHLPEHDVYAFQQHGLERRGLPDWSIERSARRYLALMRVVQPRGPYLLVGHSLGGLVALEVARLLHEAGEQVAHLALLDSYLPRTKSEQARLLFSRMEARPPRNRTLRVLRQGVDRVAKRVMPAGVPYGAQAAKRFRAYTAGVVRYGGQKDFDAFFDQAEIVTRRHHPSPFAGRSTFVLADANPDADGWGALLVGQTQTVRMACEHTSLLREPHVAELATALRAAFATALRAAFATDDVADPTAAV